MKKNIGALTALALVFSMASCSGSSSESSEVKEEKLFSQTVYKTEYAEYPDDVMIPYQLGYVDGIGIRYVYLSNDKKIKAVDYDDSMNKIDSKDLFSMDNAYEDNAFPYESKAFLDDNGEVFVFNVILRSDKLFGEAGYFDNAEVSFELRGYAPDGNESFVTNVPDMKNYYKAGEGMIKSFICVNDNFMINTNGTEIFADKEGNIVNAVKENTEALYYFCDSNNELIATFENGFAYLSDIQNLSCDNITEYGKRRENKQCPIKGSDGYRAFFVFNDGIYGFDENKNLTEVVDYKKSKIEDGSFYMATYIKNGRFAAVCNNEEKTSFVILSEKY